MVADLLAQDLELVILMVRLGVPRHHPGLMTDLHLVWVWFLLDDGRPTEGLQGDGVTADKDQ